MNKQEAEHQEVAANDFEGETKLVTTEHDARVETDVEKNMTLLEGLRTYPKAVLWSIAVAMTVIMDGYDNTLLGSFFGFPEFQKRYGEPFGDGYQVPAAWQTALSMMGSVGAIFGIFISGFCADRFGYRKVLSASLVFTMGIIFIYFFAPSRAVLLVGALLFGFPIGAFSTLAPTYASEVCPVVLRGYLTTYINMCWVIGQIISQGVLRGCLNINNEWSYRIPFAIQWIWPPIILVLIYFAPESPWWLVRKGKIEEAVHAVERLSTKREGHDPHRTVAFMVHTNELEKAVESGTSYLDCFKGVDLRRTEVSCITFLCQSISVGNVMGYSAFFFQTAGLNAENSFNLSIGMYGIGLVGTMSSWFLMGNLGRRTIYVWGLFSVGFVFLIMGFVSLAPASNGSAPWATAVLQLVIVYIYDSSVGPVCYSLISEMSSTRLRSKTISLARDAYNVWGIVNSIIYPYMLNPTAGNWKGKIGYLQAGLCFLCFLWAFFRLPEPKGRTYEELDIMFMKGVPARQFQNYVVDFDEENEKAA
ncbi:general alpha-glucoside permease [Trichomonascus vanleenenianus]|uniref:general alpha-glucoside permease n=1 Tax=Trichomonascus vanleenenianus TaxID=2268995 RepID=UPI003ECA07CD